MRRLILAIVMVAAICLTACQGLASALGQQPTATAPVFNGNGVVALPHAWVDIVASPDNSGAVGASGEASQDTAQTQVTTVDPAAVAEGIAKIAAEVVPAGRAAAMLERAQAALEAGDPELAAKRLRAAEGFQRAEAAKAPAPAEGTGESPAQ